MKKLFVITTDGGDREDGSVYYADYLLVDNKDNPDLKFEEPVFSEEMIDDSDVFRDQFVSLGYSAEFIGPIIILKE